METTDNLIKKEPHINVLHDNLFVAMHVFMVILTQISNFYRVYTPCFPYKDKSRGYLTVKSPTMSLPKPS